MGACFIHSLFQERQFSRGCDIITAIVASMFLNLNFPGNTNIMNKRIFGQVVLTDFDWMTNDEWWDAPVSIGNVLKEKCWFFLFHVSVKRGCSASDRRVRLSSQSKRFIGRSTGSRRELPKHCSVDWGEYHYVGSGCYVTTINNHPFKICCFCNESLKRLKKCLTWQPTISVCCNKM